MGSLVIAGWLGSQVCFEILRTQVCHQLANNHPESSQQINFLLHAPRFILIVFLLRLERFANFPIISAAEIITKKQPQAHRPSQRQTFTFLLIIKYDQVVRTSHLRHYIHFAHHFWFDSHSSAFTPVANQRSSACHKSLHPKILRC